MVLTVRRESPARVTLEFTLAGLLASGRRHRQEDIAKKRQAVFFFLDADFFFHSGLMVCIFFSYLQIHKTLIKLHLKIHYTSHYLC